MEILKTNYPPGLDVAQKRHRQRSAMNNKRVLGSVAIGMAQWLRACPHLPDDQVWFLESTSTHHVDAGNKTWVL